MHISAAQPLLLAPESGIILQVWITGHSLGGGYANAVVLHMLANRACAELFAAGAHSSVPSHVSSTRPTWNCAFSSVRAPILDGRFQSEA